MVRPPKNPKKRVIRKKDPTRKQSLLGRRRRFIFPWPIIVFVLLCIGVLLVGWTLQAVADDLTVTAQVHAPLPSGPAVIISPANGTHFSTAPISVSGTCPLDTYVKIYRNDFFSGTAICSASGTFQLNIDLFPGTNHLQARVFNITDDEGPPSNIVTVYYDVPQQPTNPTAAPPNQVTPSSPPIVPPFVIHTDYNYRGYKVGQTIEWTFETSGGSTPYAINIDWGDGSNTVISQKEAGKLAASHRYKAIGPGAKNSYTVKVTGSDSAGRHAYLQLFLVVNPGLPSIVANTLPSPHINDKWLLLAWPAYLVLLLMVTSFWLGEREELIVLRRRGSLGGRRI